MTRARRTRAALPCGVLAIALSSATVHAAPAAVAESAPAAPGAKPPGHRMVVAGVAITLGSVAAYGLLGVGLGLGNRAEADLVRLDDVGQIDARRDALRRGMLGNRLAIAGAVSAVVAAAVGIPLIVIGRRRATAAVRDRTVSLGISPLGGVVRLRW